MGRFRVLVLCCSMHMAVHHNQHRQVIAHAQHIPASHRDNPKSPSLHTNPRRSRRSDLSNTFSFFRSAGEGGKYTVGPHTTST